MPTDPKAILNDYADGTLSRADLDDPTKEQLWDEVHQSDSPQDLRNRLQSYPQVSPELAQELVEGRGAMPSLPAPEQAGPVTAGAKALLQMKNIPPDVLKTASDHPAIAKAMIDAALKSGNTEE